MIPSPKARHRKPSTQRQRRTADNAAQILVQVEREIAAGMSVKSACRKAGIPVPSYYRWRTRMNSDATPPDRTRETILGVAKTVFLRDGYGASLESIATAAGVARQTVYNQFGSKERLFGEVAQSVYQRVASPVLILERGSDFISTLTNFGRHFMTMAFDAESLALQRIALGEFRDTPELAKIAYALRASHAIPVLTDFIADYLREQMAQGTIDSADPLLLAEAFSGSFTSHARHRILIGIGDATPEWRETMLRLCVGVFARGLGYRGATSIGGTSNVG